MKRVYKIILSIFCLLFLGLVLYYLIFLRLGYARTNAPRRQATPIQIAFTPSPSPAPSLEPVPEQPPESTSEPSPTPSPEPSPASGIVLTGGEELDWPCGIPFRDPGFSARGANGEDIREEVSVTGEVTPWHTGDYTLTYTLPGEREIGSVQRLVHVKAQKRKTPVKPGAGTICLTYIDTPSEPTEELLTLLRRDGVNATFFISTYQTEFLDLITQMAEDGHELGIYFPDLSWYTGEEGVLEHCLSEIVRMQEIIYEKAGRYAKFIRFYGGTPNAGYLAVRMPGGYEELYQTMHDMGLLVFDWNLEVDVAELTAKISSNFTHPSKPYDYVVAMQQNFRRQSVLAVPEMIRWGKEKEYTFSVLEDSFPEVLFGDEEWTPLPEPASASPTPDVVSVQPPDYQETISAIESTIAALESQIFPTSLH